MRCLGTWCSGGPGSDGLMVDSMILEGFPNLNDYAFISLREENGINSLLLLSQRNP